MANQKFDVSIQLEGTYIADRVWSGDQIHSGWNVDNIDTNMRSVWGTTTDGWLQYRSAFATYSMRYNPLDIALQDHFFETEMSAGGMGNYEIGVMFRFKDRNNFYYLTFNGGYQNWNGRNIRLMKKTGSTSIMLADFSRAVFDRTKIYAVRVETVGGQIKVWLDGVLIFNITDSFPISNGAFGPFVLGQEFARWRFFNAKSVTGFVIPKLIRNYEVPHTNYDAATSKLLFPETVQNFMQADINAFLASTNADSYTFLRFIATSSNPKAIVLFDKVPNKNVTIDSNSRLYAFQVLPTSPPVQVTNLQGTPIDHQSIKLVWTHVDDSELGFHIVDELDNVITTVGENVFTYTQEGLDKGTTYSRRVIAFNTAGQSLPSNQVFVTTLQTIPEHPDQFRGVALSDKRIRWDWEDMSDNESEFEVVNLDEAIPVVIKRLSAGITTWTEEGLTKLTEYTRAVRARNSAGISQESNPETVTTLDEMPDPPAHAPLNFMGVGVSQEAILWTWQDRNPAVDGFRIYDENDKLVGTITENSRAFTELDLYSDMEYRRRIVAFNKGGEGPSTPLAWAKTLKYGEDQTGTPLEPFNLTVDDITLTSAVLQWDYKEHELMPALGFKIYDNLDQLVGVVEKDDMTKLLDYLLPDTSYTMYVTAYNSVGDSLPSNTISWVTGKLPRPPEEERPEGLPEDWIDPFYGVEYDIESDTTPKIKAFHSGVGDNLDLVVQNLHNMIPNEEAFEYEMYVKGAYNIDEVYSLDVPFKFKVHIDALHQDRTPYHDSTDWITGIVRGNIGVDELRFNSVVGLKSLPEGVVVTSDNYRVEFFDENDNAVPSYAAEPNEIIHWVMESRMREESLGYVSDIDMANVFSEWYKFSHNTTNRFPANTSEISSWIYDEVTGEMSTTLNSVTYMGAVSPDAYDNYDVNLTLRSNDSDNDRMGFVLAFATDEFGREHTLTAMRNHENYSGANAWDWAIIYNYGQTGSFMLDRKVIDTLKVNQGNWNVYFPKGTVLRVKRAGDVFETWASEAGTDELLESSRLQADLSSDPRLAVFQGAKPIGVAAQSQKGAAMKISGFGGERTRITYDNYMTIWTEKTGIRTASKEWRGAVALSKPLVIKEGQVLEFEAKIQSPQYQIPWQEANEKFAFNPLAYHLIITSKNPNIRLIQTEDVVDFFPLNTTFVKVKMKAQVINKDQTAWHPSIHSGFYYLNQREHFLYSNNKVLPKEESDIKSYVYNFPYIIRAYAERHYGGGDVSLVDELATDFNSGILTEGVKVLGVENRLTLKEDAKSEVFTSRVLNFGREISTWNDPVIVQNESAIADGAKAEIEMGPADELGNVETWYRPNFMPPAERMRYRLALKEGFRKEPYIGDFEQFGGQLSEGYINNVTVDNTSIQINNPTVNHEGYLITKPIPIGTRIDEMGTVELDITLPEGSSAIFYSVTANSAFHRFDIPTSTEPWIPLRLRSNENGRRTYIIDSVPKEFLAIVVRLVRSNSTPDTIAKSPIVSNMVVHSFLYNLARVVPDIDSVSVGGYIESGHWVEDYTIPLMGEVISDQSFHVISEDTVANITMNHLASIGVSDIAGLTFKDYYAEVDPAYDVELKVDAFGMKKVEAKTTAVIGDIIYQQEKLFFNPDDKTIKVRPIPQNGSPIVIKNAQGRNLTQVHFRDDNGKPTLYNTEYLQTNETRNLFLQHHASSIDQLSMKIHIQLSKDEEWTQLFSIAIIENRLVLPNHYLPFMNVIISYRLKDTFCVEYNYAPDKDYAVIHVNTSHDVTTKETMLLDIKYEVNKEHPYYVAEEINLNPLYNKLQAGFLYLSDEIYAPYKIKIVCNPTTLYRTKHESVTVHAFVYDENDNPVVGERISWEADHGVLQVRTYETDMNGMTTMIYHVPTRTSIKNDVIRASVVGRVKSSYLSGKLPITIKDEKFNDKITIVPEKRIVQGGDIVQLRVMAMGPSNERITSQLITLSANEGVVSPTSGLTNQDGELLIQYRHPMDSTVDYVIIEAVSSGAKEQIILGISGV